MSVRQELLTAAEQPQEAADVQQHWQEAGTARQEGGDVALAVDGR
jgi:hypothetical protein